MNMSNNEEIFETRVKRICMPLCDRIVTTDISNDYTLPDYQPEIRRILHIGSVVTPPTKYISATSAEFSSNVDYTVLYVGADGELYSAPLSAEYAFNVPIDTDGFDFNDTVSSCVDTAVESVNTRLSGPRKLNIKCRLRSHTRVYGTMLLDEKINGSVRSNTVQILEETCNNAEIIRGSGEILEMSHEIIPAAANSRVITADGKVLVTNIVPDNDMASIEGDIYLKLLCADVDAPDKLERIIERVPFSDTVELGGLLRESDCTAYGYMSDIAVSVEEGRIVCDMGIILEIEAQNKKTFEYVKDMYSTENESSCSFRDYSIPTCAYCSNGNFSMNERISKESVGIPESAEIVDIFGTAIAEGSEVNDTKMQVNGSVKYMLIVRNNDEYSSQEILLPARYEFDCQNNSVSTTQSTMNVLSCRARDDNEFISIDAEIGVASVGVGCEEIITLDEITFGETVDKCKNEITVCYPSNDDSLWSIAKRYHTSMARIESINAISGSIEDRNYIIV